MSEERAPAACRNCLHWRPIPTTQTIGHCKAAPPTAFPGGDAAWPRVGAGDRCGVHRPAVEEQER